MPTVPTYDSFQVAPEALPSVRIQDTQPGDAGLQLGAGEQKFGEDLMQAATRLQRQQNANAIFTAEAGFKEQQVQYQNQALQRQGHDASGVTTDWAKQWADSFQKASEGLENDEQRQIFAKTMEPLKLQLMETMSRHEAQQLKVSVEQSANASMETSVNLAAANPTPDVIAQSKSDILKRISATAGVNGWTPEITQAATTEQLTKLHSQVIGSLIDTNPDQAKAYLDANRSEIAGTQLDALDKAVRVGTIADQSQKATADILSRNTSESAALAEARKDYSGQVQDAIVTRIKERFGESEQIKDRNEKDAADKAWKILTQPGAGYAAIPASLLNSVSGQTVKALQDEAARRARGEDATTDWGKFTELRDLAATQPDQFTKVDLRNYPLANAERKQLIDMQADLMKPNAAKDVASFDMQLKAAHNVMRLGASQKAQMGQFDSLAQSQVNDLETQLKRKPTFSERQAVIDKLMQPGTVPGMIFGTNNTRNYQAQSAGKTFTATMPDTDRAQLLSAFKAKGIGNPTEDQITTAWRKWRGF